MLEHQVKVPGSQAGSYTVRIGNGFLDTLWQQIEKDYPNRNKFVVSDKNVQNCGHLAKLSGSADVPVFVVTPAGEISKNISTVISIIEAMEKACLGRDTLLIALGGGTVGDMAGFAASIFKRGVPVLQIPTTTLAQADSAVGGKTGVDSSMSKNAYGAFLHPVAVYIDVAVLTTLDERQYRAGLVETVKHAIIADSQYFDWLENNMDSLLNRRVDVLEHIAYMNCKIKGSIVEADPDEKNQRRMLNYGHTIGHAIEAASGFELLHGEAVAIGIIAAGMIEVHMGLAGQDKLDRVRSLLEKLGVPLAMPDNITAIDIITLLKHDKKAVGKWPKFVLTDEIGHIYIKNGQYAVDISVEQVKKILNML